MIIGGDAMESYNADNHNSQVYSEEPRNAGITSRSTVSLFVRLFANFHLHKIKLRVLLITIYPTYSQIRYPVDVYR